MPWLAHERLGGRTTSRQCTHKLRWINKGFAHADEVYQHTHLQAKAVLLEEIEREYEHEPVDQNRLKDVLEIFIKVSLQSYHDDFEVHMLNAKQQHYKRMAAEWKETDSCPEYLKKAEACLQAEAERAACYLHPSSKQAVIKKVQSELLETPQVLTAVPFVMP
jgi:cullin 1